MQWLLVACFLLGLGQFVLFRRRLDTFTVAFFSAAIYFLPGLVGYTLTPVTPESPIKLPIEMEPEAIGIMLLVMASIMVGALLWDRVDLRRAPPSWRIQCTGTAAYVAAVLGALGLLWAVVETGPLLFSPDKSEVITVVSRGHLLWEMGAATGAIFAYAFGKRFVLLFCLGLLALDMWIGFRYAFAMTFIAIAWMAIWRDRPYRLIDLRKGYLLVILMGGLAIISYQNLKEPVRQGDWGEVAERVSNPLWYGKGIMTSEPFTTQTVLNEIVRNDFRTNTDHLWSAALHLIVFSPLLGAQVVRFNELQQPALFPTVDHGLADNIWGQMWSALGWPGLVAFVIIYNLILAAGARSFRSGDPAVRAGIALLFAYWCFYIHRNELMVQVGYTKQVILLWLACVVVGGLLDGAAARARLGWRPRN